jgi:hypothetical protein
MAEIRVKETGTIKLFESDNTSSVTIASPASLGADRTITLPDASVTLASGTMLATDGSGASLTALNASELGSGTVPTARLGSGTASSSVFLAGDNTWAAAGGGKVLQVVRGVLATTTTVTGTTATEIMNTSITPAADANFIYAQVNTNYWISCNDNTSNPYGNFQIKVGSTSGTSQAKAKLRDINTAGATNVDKYYMGALSGYWSEGTTSAVAVYLTLEMGTTTGAIHAFGDNTCKDGTTLTLMEIEA